MSVDVTTRTRAHTPRAHVTHSRRLSFCKFPPRSRRRPPAFPTEPSSPLPSPTSSGPFSAALRLCSLRSNDCVALVIARQCTHASSACLRVCPQTRKPRFFNRFVSAHPKRKHPPLQALCSRPCCCPRSSCVSRVGSVSRVSVAGERGMRSKQHLTPRKLAQRTRDWKIDGRLHFGAQGTLAGRARQARGRGRCLRLIRTPMRRGWSYRLASLMPAFSPPR